METPEKILRTRNCICCNCVVEELDFISPNMKEWEGMWRDGVVEKIQAGYGSSMDGDIIVIAVCDECLKKKRSEGVVTYVGNYLFPNIDEESIAYHAHLKKTKEIYENGTGDTMDQS